METKIKVSKSECILIEGPRQADAEFLGKWLLAAAEADKIVDRARSDSAFHELVGRLEVLFKLEFGLTAVMFFERLATDTQFYTSVIESDSYEAEMLSVLVGMGFFQRNDARYQMALPEGLDIVRIRNALSKLADTEDEDCQIHPEWLMTCMPGSEAKRLQQQIESTAAGRSHRKSGDGGA